MKSDEAVEGIEEHDEQATERHGREETRHRHAWISPVASGRVNQKAEPRPGALSTPTCP